MISRSAKKQINGRLNKGIALNVGAARITPKNEIKYLGVTFDHRGTFRKYVCIKPIYICQGDGIAG